MMAPLPGVSQVRAIDDLRFPVHSKRLAFPSGSSMIGPIRLYFKGFGLLSLMRVFTALVDLDFGVQPAAGLVLRQACL